MEVQAIRYSSIPYPLNCEFVHNPGFAPLIIIPVEDADTVACQIWLDAGSNHDPVGLYGLAHMYEHLVYSNGEPIDSRTAVMDDAFTSYDYAAHCFRSLPGNLRDNWSSIVDGFSLPNLSLDNVRSEQRIIAAEIAHVSDRRRGLNDPSDIISTMFSSHRYGESVIGKIDDIHRAKFIDINSFAEYNGKVASSVVIAGKISFNQGRKFYESCNLLARHKDNKEDGLALVSPGFNINRNGKLITIQIGILAPKIESDYSVASSAFAFFLRNQDASTLFPELHRNVTLKQCHGRRVVHRKVGVIVVCITFEIPPDFFLDPWRVAKALKTDMQGFGDRVFKASDALQLSEKKRNFENLHRLQDHTSHARYLGWLSAISEDLGLAASLSFSTASRRSVKEYVDNFFPSDDMFYVNVAMALEQCENVHISN